jgi:heat shock protein 90kDa beta
MSILFTRGTHLFPYLFPTLDTFCYHLFRPDARPLTITVVIELEKYDKTRSRKKKKILKKSSINCSKRKSRVQEQVGAISGDSGKKTDDSMPGDGTRGKGKRGLENTLKSWVKVRIPSALSYVKIVDALYSEKRVAAEQAEADFFVLLRECGVVKQDSSWKDVKRKISNDPRYDAVGSSSLREELFNTFMKANVSLPTPAASSSKGDSSHNNIDDDVAELERKRKEKKERAVREREQKVKSDMTRVEAEIGRSRIGLNKEEDEREFRCAFYLQLSCSVTRWRSTRPFNY